MAAQTPNARNTRRETIANLQRANANSMNFVREIERKSAILLQDIKMKQASRNSHSLEIVRRFLLPRLRKYSETRLMFLQYIAQSEKMIQVLLRDLKRRKTVVAKQGGKNKRRNRTINKKTK